MAKPLEKPAQRIAYEDEYDRMLYGPLCLVIGASILIVLAA